MARPLPRLAAVAALLVSTVGTVGVLGAGPVAANGPPQPAVTRASDETWFVSNRLATGRADYELHIEAGLGGEALVGDWDGNGRDTPARRKGNIVTFLDERGRVDTRIAYGKAGDEVFSGDWDGDGTDTLAVRRGNVFYFKNSIRGGQADAVIGYGRSTDDVLVGDWDGDGDDTLAVRRGNVYYIKNSIRGGPADRVVGYGRGGDRVLVGDWDGDGTDTLAVKRGNVVFVRNDLRTAPAQFSFAFGVVGDDAYPGDWDGDGDDTLAVRRPVEPPDGADGLWQLVFADEFTGGSLDESSWTRCYWWHRHWPDAGCTNEGTGERQWYSPSLATVSGGRLKLTAVDTPFTESDGTTHPYRSAIVTTGRDSSDKSEAPGFAFTYGFAEMRARLPEGKGLWPAFWLLPTSHISRPEIDVIEVLGQDPDIAHFNYHYTEPDGDRRDVGESRTVADLSVGWHTFGVEWRRNALIWFVDGVERWRYTGPGISDEPMYLLANLAVGGWPGNPDSSTEFPAVMEIDYIRVWQR